jgi:hypothetical protein
VILLVFTRFLHVFPPGPRRLQKRMHFVVHQMAKPSPRAVIYKAISIGIPIYDRISTGILI